MPYQFLADAVLTLHFGVVVFVVGELGAVLVGNWLGWRWVNGWWFRILHLTAIAFIVIQTWLGQWCPLTLLESWLRKQAGVPGYSQSFIEHWLQPSSSTMRRSGYLPWPIPCSACWSCLPGGFIRHGGNHRPFPRRA